MKNVQDFFTIYQQSAWEKNVEKMVALYDENVLIFDMWEQGHQRGLSEWSIAIKDWLGSLKNERVNVIFESIQIREDSNVAFASALIIFQAMTADNNILRSMKNRITLGLTRKGTEWKVVHQHTSAPVTFDLKAILDF